MKKSFFILVLGSLLISAPAWAEDPKIEIKEYEFVPKSLTVAVGTKVTWVNRDEIPHTIDDGNKGFHSAALDTDDTYSYIFTQPGTYQYFCRLHPHMTGTIAVTAK